MSKFMLAIVREVEPHSETDCGLCLAAVSEYDGTDRCEVFANALEETGFDFAANHRTLRRLPACVAAEKKIVSLTQIKHTPIVHAIVNGQAGYVCLVCSESLSSAQVKASEEENGYPACNEVE